MPGSSHGKLFKVTTWGESHGPALGVVIDGCPPGLELTENDLQAMMDRRKPGSSLASTARKEEDKAMIMSGVFEGKTTGTPIMIMIQNKDHRSKDYSKIKDLFRPGHGDITYHHKYGIRDYRGGGRASARETAARVAAGAVAAVLNKKAGIRINALTMSLGGIKAEQIVEGEEINNNYLCPDPQAAVKMDKRVKDVLKKGDSLGGIVEIKVNGVPAGLGEPVFDKLDGDLAKALMSIGAVKGIEIGAGFESACKKGSENNDEITPDGFVTNNSGGILAGISNGDELVLRVAVKPIPSILIDQKTIDTEGEERTISTRGRHDISPIPRINVVCEAMVHLVLADHLLRQKSIEWIQVS